jgi:nicotinamidase-related amidase
MGDIENKYFHQPPGEISLLPPIDIDPAKTALVVIDMQYHDAHADHGVVAALEKLHPGSTAYYAERLAGVVPAIRRLLDHARATDLNVIHLVVGSDYQDLRDFNKRMRHWILDLQERSGMADFYWTKSPTYRILEELTPAEGETVYRKRSYGAFNSTNFENLLREMDIDTLLVTGCVTNYCVETTVRDAADRGFAVAMIDEAIAGFSQESHDATMASLRGGFAAVIPTAAAAIAMLNEIRNPDEGTVASPGANPLV